MLQAFIERHPLATLVAMTAGGLAADHVPIRAQLKAGGAGLLRGHIARANSLWRALEPRATVLAVFTGADTYVSPAWDPSKREHAWRVSDAPADYIEAMLRAIVGFEIEISEVVGKFKGSQNRPAADRVAVREALRGAGRSADEIAELVPDPGPS